MTVLVLGSGGLVGRRLVSRLAAGGTAVVAADVVPAPQTGEQLPFNVTYERVDTTRIDQVLDVMQRHTVSEVALLSYIMGPLMSPEHRDILQACAVNVTGVTNVLEAARLSGVRRVVFFSTVGTYGPQSLYGERQVNEDDVQAPTSLYGRMKLLNESLCERYGAMYGLDVVRLRPSAILGPGSTIWPSRLIEPVAVGERGMVQWGIDKRDNVVAVDDLVALLATILRAETVAHRVYLASAHNVTMRELVEALIEVVPDADVEFPTPERQPSYPQWFDNTRAVDEFGWELTPLVESVRRHVEGVRRAAGLDVPPSGA
jgi:nucleoside-diphosphate-sugar epimerase